MRATMRLRCGQATGGLTVFATDAKGQTLYEHVQAHPQFLLGSGPEEAYTRKTPCSRIHRVSYTALGTGTKHMRLSYETILDTMDSASCRGVHADWLLLESLSATREERCGMAYWTWG